MYMIDIASQTVTLTATYTRAIGVPYVNAVAVSSDGTSVYLARGGSSGSGSTVEVFDGTSGANAGSIPLPDPSTPTAGVFSADGTKLYVSDIRAGIRVIDTGSNTLTLTMAGPTSRGYDIGITPDDARLYTTFISNVYVNDTGTNSPITTITGDYTNVYNLTVSPGQAGPPSPDVVMTDVTPNASSVAAGGTLSVSDTVKNQGTASTDSAFFIGYVLSPTTDYNDPGAVAITTTRAVGPLAPPDTDTATTDLLIPSTTPPGTYHVCALADSTQALSESNVDNNTKCSDATVQVSRPDLIMTAVTPNSTSFTPGGTLSVTDTVQNQGGAPTTVSFTIAYRLSPEPPTAPCNLGPSGATTAPPSCYVDSNAVTISTTRTVGLLAAGASSMATTSLLIPGSTAPGNYHVCAFADSTNAVGGEIDENNNMSCSSITVGPAVPDLIMTATSTAATAVAPGSNFTLSNTVKNQGGAAAGSFAIAFHLSTNTTYGDGDDIAFTATRSVGSLSAGASSSASTSLNVPASTPLGNYYVCVMADSNNTVNEGSPTNENNNTRCTAATINVTRPDLIMTAVTPNSGTVSTTATLSVTNSAKNQGVVSAGSSKVGFVLSLTANYDDPGAIAITTTRTISTLAAGATSTGTTNLAIPKTTPPDNYYVCAKADSAGTVTELDETNNTLCSPGTVVVPPPDLVMTAASTTTTVVAPGKALSLSNTVQNQGLFPAGAFAVAFHLSTDTTYGNGDDIAFTTTRSVTSLNSGATSTGSTSLTVPAGTAFGAYYICAMADSNDTVNEGPNEGNNTLCTASTVQVSDPDLIMTSVSPNSSTATKGGTLSVTTTVQNTGPLASTAFRIAFRLSPNTVYGDSDDVTITAIRSVTSLAAGASSTGTTSLTIPTSTPSGTYYVCSKADSLNQVTELDEGNNTLCSDGAAITQVTIP
jgi:subtilase family serine protease